MTTTTPDLVATCWTSAGNVGPLDTSEASPIPVLERVRAVGATGWMGMGLVYDDLLVVQDTIGFAELRRHAHAAGLRHLEVELATGWWRTEDQSWRDKWNLLLEAATELGAAFIKIGTEFGEPVTDLTMFVDPLRSLADEAAAALRADRVDAAGCRADPSGGSPGCRAARRLLARVPCRDLVGRTGGLPGSKHRVRNRTM